ncbi:hypothetical protein [Sphingobium yanoikuyae]|uniref:Uncharacterized protein n=1 Tax=Sphingobium yanoikuyae TaxID=13690 RepID=A0A430BX34_SPHYA|nr:hypothetical protein [Sphingobium yanoikuyae]RSU57213.1 hypothetical protein DAH51_10395 [Sphingobium yanoikuyae]
MTASACSNRPAAPAVSHPPADDLTCQAEPAAPVLPVTPTGDIDWQAFDAAGLAFDRDALIAGRSCRDALARVCGWHKMRGAQVNC